MKTDVQIASEAKLKPIREIANSLGIDEKYILPYGNDKAKVDLKIFKDLEDRKDGKLILVTAINPTPAGEGKTTMNIGLSMGLNKIGKKAICTIREPSLGPSFGIKGGAAGGGYSQVVPMADINLHFTGDFHAITSAHNLISAMFDNHLKQGNELNIDPRLIAWKRVMDINDRSLRNIVIGLGGEANGVPREDGFDITVASEIMAILCLASDLKDLKERISKIVIAYTYDKEPVYVKDIKAEGAATLLLKDAINPNLVQTIENTPAFIHGGPFANIAHGCNSIVATKMALKLGDYVVTEAGFGADLGAEKFFNIKSRYANLKPSVVVIVATIRALKHHGGASKEELGVESLEKLEKGYSNLEKHIENVRKFGLEMVVAINRFPTDTQKEIDKLISLCEKNGVCFVTATCWKDGSDGAIELAKKVVEIADASSPDSFHTLYDLDLSIEEKLNIISREIYGARGVKISSKIKNKIKEFEKNGFGKYPICMAKTQYSFSDNPDLLGRPTDFDITISDLRISNGAGFIVALTGDVMTMPGLPKVPAAVNMDIKEDGEIVGLF